MQGAYAEILADVVKSLEERLGQDGQGRDARAFELDHAEGRAAVLQYDVMITPGMGWEAMTEHMRLFASLAPLYGLEVGAVREE